MNSSLLLIFQSVFYFLAMSLIFYSRRVFGLGVFICALGVMHFLETYLAAVFFIQLPFGLVSPGSTVLFAGKLAMILLVYIKEDAETVRQPIYGLLVGNCLMVAMGLVLRFYGAVVPMAGYEPDLRFLDQMGILMVWGTVLLFIDSIMVILIYEKMGERLSNTLFGRIFISCATVLVFDQLLFFAGLRIVADTPLEALAGGLVAKVAASAIYGLLIVLYLTFLERQPVLQLPRPLVSTFDKLTYRHRFEQLQSQAGLDALTGVKDRGRFEAEAQRLLDKAAASGMPVAVMMIDIDRFKSVNDKLGHQAGDSVLRGVADRLSASLRPADQLFRYGGEEFLVVCPSISEADAYALAERMRTSVEAGVKAGADTAVTISIGVAVHGGSGALIAAMVDDADRKLYAAKDAGRNRTMI